MGGQWAASLSRPPSRLHAPLVEIGVALGIHLRCCTHQFFCRTRRQPRILHTGVAVLLEVRQVASRLAVRIDGICTATQQHRAENQGQGSRQGGFLLGGDEAARVGPRAAPNRISPLKGLGAGNADERRQGRCPAGFKLGWQPPCVTSYTDWCRRADRVPAARLACRLPPANPTLHFLFGFNACGCRRRYDDVYLEPNQLDGEVGRPFRSTLRRSILDHDVLALDPPQLTQTLSKCLRRCELELDEARRTRMRGPFQPVAPQEQAARPGGRR